MDTEHLVEINPTDVTVLFGAHATLHGNLKPYPVKDETQGENPDLWVDGMESTDDFLSWTVESRVAGEHRLAVTYSCSTAGIEYEVVAGESHVACKARATAGLIEGDYSVWTSFEKETLSTPIFLSEGTNSIELKIKQDLDAADTIRFYTLELTPPPAVDIVEAARTRALASRASTDWFVEAKYGVTFHWTPTSHPRRGPQKPFPEAVQNLDVESLARTVKESGAGYVIFTSTHAPHWFPAPIEAIEKILPGNTCKRDLIGDLADALNSQGVKLLLYYPGGRGYEDDAPGIPWGKASGWTEDKSIYFDNFCKIFTEIGERYGDKIAGYWFDFCPFNVSHRFEPLYRAAKTGNPDRIIAWNSWINRIPSDFQEFLSGEIATGIVDIDRSTLRGLQPHIWIIADDEDWVHETADTEIGPPHLETGELIDFVRRCAEGQIVVSMNIGIYQDGGIGPATLEQLKALRQAIRGAN